MVRVYPDKLPGELGKQLAPVYLLYGDEPLGQMETGDLIRQQARQQGFAEREVIFALEDADWDLLRHASDSLSLFSELRIIDLRIPSGKPGRQGAEVLKTMMQEPTPDIVMLISMPRLDRSATNSAWFKAIDKVGVTVPFYQLALNQLPAWIEQRMRKHRLQATPDAIKLIASRVEGNMLAAQQEIERLALLYPETEIDTPQVLSAVAESARFSLNDVVDAAMRGAANRTLKVLGGLRDEGVVPILILWSLTQEVRAGTRIAQSLAVGISPDAAMKAAGVWQNRRQPMQLALSRHSEQSWLEMLATTAQLDRLVKGQGQGDVWDELAGLCLKLAAGESAGITLPNSA